MFGAFIGIATAVTDAAAAVVRRRQMLTFRAIGKIVRATSDILAKTVLTTALIDLGHKVLTRVTGE